MQTIVRIAILGSVLLTNSACYPMTRTVAERCVLVDVHGEQSREPIPLLHELAEAHAMEADTSHPLNPRYLIRSEGSLVAEVSYRLGMGSAGAVLTLFRFDEERSTAWPDLFDEFVEQELALRYKVTPCEDVADFQMPETYRPPNPDH